MKALLYIVILGLLGHIKKLSVLTLGLGLVVGSLIATLAGFNYQIFTVNLSSIDWNAISAIVMAVTIFYIYKQTRATEKMAEDQMIPAVDVNMEYDESSKKSHFWFSNLSHIPAVVELTLETTLKKHPINGDRGGFYLSPKEPGRQTQDAYSFDWTEHPPNRTRVNLVVLVRPAFENCLAKFNFIKSYQFHAEKLRWDEYTWGFPDRELRRKSDAVMITEALVKIELKMTEILNEISKK